jgi:hypothetical protein
LDDLPNPLPVGVFAAVNEATLKGYDLPIIGHTRGRVGRSVLNAEQSFSDDLETAFDGLE